jgi:hypothetical protein
MAVEELTLIRKDTVLQSHPLHALAVARLSSETLMSTCNTKTPKGAYKSPQTR